MTTTNSIIGPYRIIDTVGKGGMGVVWRAEHLETGKIVALKTITVAKKGLLRSIRREIQALARLRHPGIVKIVDEGIHDGLPYYAMELIDGQPLPQWQAALSPGGSPNKPQKTQTTLAGLTGEPLLLLQEAPKAPDDTLDADEDEAPATFVGQMPAAPELPLARILTVVRRVCLALASLHSEGIVHRDLKPENILVLPGDQPMIIDFGIASAQSTTGREQMTLGDRSQQGTIAYMSLEQIEGTPLDARADLYSLGVLLFELLTGRKPFSGDNPQAILWAHYSEKPPKPSQFAPNIPASLDSLVLRLLSKERNDRPGYASDVAQALLILGATSSGEEEIARPKTYLYRPGFSGRAKELEQLRQRAIRVRNESGGLLFVEGTGGVGKTRLLLEVARDLSQRGFAVLLGECKDKNDDLSFNAFRKILQELSDRCVERGPAEAERLLGRRGRILSLYEPSLANLPGQAKVPTLTDELPQEAILNALAETLLALSQSQPLVILLDDLQWADELSLAFLEFFRQREQLSRWILLIGAYRVEDAQEKLKRLVEAPKTERLVLGRLNEESVAQMVGDMLALTPPPKRLSAYLTEHSSGNPFFVAEYLRAAVDEKLLRRDPQGRWQVVGLSDDEGENISGRWQISGAAEADYKRLALPRTLQDLVERRLAGLSKGARAALEAFAVIGRVADIDLLAWVVPLTEDMLDEALDELSRRQIIEEAGSGKLRFIHEKLREFGYEKMPPKARSGLHRAAAEAIEGLYEDRDEHLAALGHHWESAGATEKAKQYHLKAARHALLAHQHQQAERAYLAYLQLNPAPTQTTIVVRNELAERLFQVKGRFAEAIEQHQKALEEARSLQLAGEIIDSLRNIGQVNRWLGKLDVAEQLVEEALRLAAAHPDPRRRGIIYNTRANLHLARGQLDRAKQLYGQAIAVYHETNERRLEGITLTNLANLALQQGNLDEAPALIERAVTLARELQETRTEAIALLHRSSLLVHQGSLEEAQQLLTQELNTFRELGDRRFEAIALGEMAELERWRSPEGAEKIAKEAEELLRNVGDKLALGKILRVRGHLAIHHGMSASEFIKEIEQLAETLHAEPESELQRRLEILRRAEEARHDSERLIRGQLRDDIPTPLLKSVQK